MLVCCGQHDLLRGLVACCRDQNNATRKFAAFALGNAVFYDDSLCLTLAPAVPALVALLSDEPKTVANAAAALGNLVLVQSKLLNAVCGSVHDGDECGR